MSDLSLDETADPMTRLVTIMARLRDPDTGCPWDVEQDFASIAPYTIEEAYEVADAIHRGVPGDIKEELGDLLLQVVFHSQMAREAGWFALDDVALAIVDKLIRRHPHVFADADARSTEQQTTAWEAAKAAERGAKGKDGAGVLANVPVALPALTRALKLQNRMARIGFDWQSTSGIDAKISEELAELNEARQSADQDQIEAELGDVLFTLVNLARRLSVDPEQALARTNHKFERRVALMEAQGPIDGLDFPQLEALWLAAKDKE